jgi:hypothetical protein
MRQFWQKLPNDYRIDYIMKIEALHFRKRNGRFTVSCGISWRKSKKQIKMAAKRDGKVIFFLNKSNCIKAFDIKWKKKYDKKNFRSNMLGDNHSGYNYPCT